MNDFGQTATAVDEVAIGAAKTAGQVAADPMGTARKQVRSFERKGAPAVRRINGRINAMFPDKLTVFGIEVNERLPEKVAIKGLHLVKGQARREDMVGGVAKRTLRVFNGSFKTIARAASRLEQATAPTATRPAAAKPATAQARPRTAPRPAARVRNTN